MPLMIRWLHTLIRHSVIEGPGYDIEDDTGWPFIAADAQLIIDIS